MTARELFPLAQGAARTIMLAVLPFLGLWTGVSAQQANGSTGGDVTSQVSLTIECLAGASNCVRARRTASEWFLLRLTRGNTPVAANVRLATSRGRVAAQTRSSGDGTLRIRWSGAVVGKDTVTIEVEAQEQGGWEARRILLLTPAPAERAPYTLHRISGQDQYWFRDRLLRDPILLRVEGVTTQHPCTHAVAVFRVPGGGLATPDTVRGRSVDGQCVVEAHWKLANHVGEQHLMASLVGAPTSTVHYSATARQPPRPIFGLVGSVLRQGFDTLRVVQREGQVPDTTLVSARLPVVDAIIGVDFPVLASYPHLRASIAVSATDPRNSLYLGISPIQLKYGEDAEAGNIDLHLGLQIARPKVWELDEEKGFVSDRKVRVTGPTLMLQFDGAGIVNAILSRFGGG